MKRRMTLGGKILLVAFGNIALLGLGVLFLLSAHYGFQWSALVIGPAEANVLTTSRIIRLEMNRADRSGWDATLARLSQEYGMALRFVEEDGTTVAGAGGALPAEVLEKVREEHMPPAEFRGSGKKGMKKGGPPDGGRIFLAVTAGPERYWVGARTPLGGDDEPPMRTTLLMSAPALWKFPFFRDYLPIVYALLAAAGLSVLCWWPFLRGVTRSIGQLSKATQELAHGRFAIELPHERHDELGDLAVAVKQMATQLERFVHGQKRLLGDIAHELSSPVARLQFSSSILEHKAGPELQPQVERVQQEIAHMSGLVNELLLFTKAGLQPPPAALGVVNLSGIVERVVALEAPGNPGVVVRVDTALEVTANAEYLVRALGNLLRNALRYAGDAGPITIAAARLGDRISVVVSDCGPGLPVEEMERVFEPFHRLETERGAETGGVGLGLAIVKTCVEACGGRVTCRNRQPSGLAVELLLR